jgi:hypothetical protein
MFEKRDYRVYKGVKTNKIYPQICDFWTRQGFYVTQISPVQIQGESYQSNIGLRREFYLHLNEQKDSTYFDLTFRARVTDTGAVGGAAAAVIFWPAAVVGGALSYSEYEKDANSMMYNFWNFVNHITNKKGELPPGAVPPTPPPAHYPPPPYAPPPPPPPPPSQPPPQAPPQKQPATKGGPKPKDPEKKTAKETTKEALVKPPEKLEEYHPTAEKSTKCSECDALLASDWKACPYCGKQID